jgi:hypothetical protein
VEGDGRDWALVPALENSGGADILIELSTWNRTKIPASKS